MRPAYSKSWLVVFFALLFGVGTLSYCGGGSGGGDDSGGNGDNGDNGGDSGASAVTVTISPSDTASVKRAATISGTFSAAIQEPLSWFGLVSLTREGSSTNLCTSFSYNSTSRALSCGHGDLEANTTYTVTVSGLKDTSGQCVADTTHTFATGLTSPVSSVSKTSITSTSGGTVEVTFNFSSALASGLTPSVGVATGASASLSRAATKAISAGSCTFNSDRTSCTTTVSGVAGCNDPADYTLTFSLDGYEDYTLFFNSADNEFEDNDAVNNNPCWEQDRLPTSAGSGDFSWASSNGELVMTVSNLGSEHNIYFDQPFAGDKEGAYAVYLSDLATLATSGSVIDLVLVQATNLDFNGLTGILSGYNGNISGGHTGWGSLYQASSSSTIKYAVPMSTGDLMSTTGATEGLYICQTAHSGTLTTYFSTDGENYVKLTDDNMRCGDNSSSCDLDQIDGRSISGWNDLRLSLQLGSNNSSGTNDFYAKFGYARFRTSNLNGSMADCPRINL